MDGLRDLLSPCRFRGKDILEVSFPSQLVLDAAIVIRFFDDRRLKPGFAVVRLFGDANRHLGHPRLRIFLRFHLFSSAVKRRSR